MSLHRWLCLVSFGCVVLSACSATNDAEEGEDVGAAQAAISVNDSTNQVCFDANSAAQCNAHDGVHMHQSGMCTITTKQQCTWLAGECRCKVVVVDTTGPCDNKNWGDFFNHC